LLLRRRRSSVLRPGRSVMGRALGVLVVRI
jgi:hypothetical protein